MSGDLVNCNSDGGWEGDPVGFHYFHGINIPTVADLKFAM